MGEIGEVEIFERLKFLKNFVLDCLIFVKNLKKKLPYGGGLPGELLCGKSLYFLFFGEPKGRELNSRKIVTTKPNTERRNFKKN
jgi:hypothetical protein